MIRGEPSNETAPPFTIVLLGGIASGKSTVAALFAKKGAIVLDADVLAHEELQDPEVVATVRAEWGDRILGADGRVDRKKLGDVVFGEKNRPQLAKLEGILHPRVLARIASRLRGLATPPSAPRKVVVLDVPLAGETALAASADLVVLVQASVETRRARARDRGWSPGELERREARQISPEEKRAMAHAVVDNDHGLSETERDVERIWSSLIRPRLEARG